MPSQGAGLGGVARGAVTGRQRAPLLCRQGTQWQHTGLRSAAPGGVHHNRGMQAGLRQSQGSRVEGGRAGLGGAGKRVRRRRSPRDQPARATPGRPAAVRAIDPGRSPSPATRGAAGAECSVGRARQGAGAGAQRRGSDAVGVDVLVLAIGRTTLGANTRTGDGGHQAPFAPHACPDRAGAVPDRSPGSVGSSISAKVSRSE